MIWVQHDLYKNFIRSFNIGDINMSLDIFRSELTDILIHKTQDFFDLLEKLKIKYDKKASFQELLNLTLKEFKKNEKFVRGLAFIIGQNAEVIKNNPKISWIKLLDGIKKGIEHIADYFQENPRREKLFVKKTLEMIELKSSVSGDVQRPVIKKDNTLAWVIGLTVLGVAGYFIYRHFNKIHEDRLRAESLRIGQQNINTDLLVDSNTTPNVKPTQMPTMATGGSLNAAQPKPVFEHINDPAYNVSTDVLLPANDVAMPNANSQAQNGVQIQVQPISNAKT